MRTGLFDVASENWAYVSSFYQKKREEDKSILSHTIASLIDFMFKTYSYTFMQASRGGGGILIGTNIQGGVRDEGMSEPWGARALLENVFL